jgi:hypothetical protein
MGHTISRHARPPRRRSGTATGQVTFSPLWQPNRLLLRIRRHGMVTLEQPTISYVSAVQLRSVKRIFRTSTFGQL